MGYRKQDLVRTCAVCDRTEASRCQRCERPLCDQHSHHRTQRCAECEAEHAERVVRLPPPPDRRDIDGRRVARAAATIVPATLFAFMAILYTPFAIPALALFALFLYNTGASVYRTRFPERVERRRFLKEKKRALLTAGKSAGNESDNTTL